MANMNFIKNSIVLTAVKFKGIMTGLLLILFKTDLLTGSPSVLKIIPPLKKICKICSEYYKGHHIETVFFDRLSE